MIGLFRFVLAILASPFKSKLRLEAENAVLRHQLIVLRRRLQGRVRLTNPDRWFFIQLYRWFPSILQVLTIIRPETLVRWHRAFRCYWRWKSRRRGGRPPIDTDLRALIRQMSTENLLWGAPRVHGELLKVGFEVAQSSVAKYMVKRRGPPSQGRKTFLRNHAPDIAAMDLFVVPTIGFKLLYGFVIVRIDRRDLVWINVTTPGKYFDGDGFYLFVKGATSRNWIYRYVKRFARGGMSSGQMSPYFWRVTALPLLHSRFLIVRNRTN